MAALWRGELMFPTQSQKHQGAVDVCLQRRRTAWVDLA